MPTDEPYYLAQNLLDEKRQQIDNGTPLEIRGQFAIAYALLAVADELEQIKQRLPPVPDATRGT